MLAKITSKNQPTLPKRIVKALGNPTYLEVEVQDGRLILTPPGVSAADAIRRKLEALGITESDVVDAVAGAGNRRFAANVAHMPGTVVAA